MVVNLANILKPETLALFLFFVVPGFLAIRVYDLIVPSERRNFGQSVIDVVTYSLLNLAVWFLPLVLLLNNPAVLPKVNTFLYYVVILAGVIIVVFLSPVALAVGYHRFLTWKRLRGILVHPVPTGWDWFFGQEPRTCWILFHLKSGAKVGGFYGGDSFASSHPATQQVYVEEVWALSDDLKFQEKVDQTAGAIINKEDCDVIELFVFEERKGRQNGEESR